MRSKSVWQVPPSQRRCPLEEAPGAAKEALGEVTNGKTGDAVRKAADEGPRLQDPSGIERLPESLGDGESHDATAGHLGEHKMGRLAEGPREEGANRDDEAQIALTTSQRAAIYREIRDDIKSTDQKAMFFHQTSYRVY